MNSKIDHLYIHVPFCRTICYYCDFCRRVYDSDLADKWLERLAADIDQHCKDSYQTIYIGGGTPTSLSNEQFEILLKLIRPYTADTQEYTIEANPESLDEDKIILMKRYGINRVSLGVQSTDEEIIKTINRHHNLKMVKNCVSLLKKHGISNISIDLMYSLPGQTMAILKQSLDDITGLNICHISIYALTIEENSVFGKKNIKNLDEDIEADMYEYIEQYLTERSFIHYEVSNYAKEGCYSKHNMGYWRYDDFLGLSCGASGKINDRRYTITSDLNNYINGENILSEDLHLSKEDLMFENIMMSLRTIEGIDIEQFNQKYDTDILKHYDKALKNNKIKIEHGRIICTDRELLNSVLLGFMDIGGEKQ